MEIFNYGIKEFDKRKFIIPTKVNNFVNKVNGGIWGCPKNDLYSDWFVLTLFVPELVSKDQKVVGSIISIKENAKILNLTINNYKYYTLKGILEFEKIKDFDVIHFSEDIIQIKQFESYYFESYQILNYDAIEYIKECDMDIEYIMSNEFKQKANKIFKKTLKHLKTTNVYKNIKKKKK